MADIRLTGGKIYGTGCAANGTALSFYEKEAVDMLNIVGLDIEINRGNAAGLTFHFEGDDVPENGTVVTLMVRSATSYDYNVIEKESTVQNGAVEFSFEPEDTEELTPKQYYWNACIQYTGGLEPWTIMKDWAGFRVLPG